MPLHEAGRDRRGEQGHAGVNGVHGGDQLLRAHVLEQEPGRTGREGGIGVAVQIKVVRTITRVVFAGSATMRFVAARPSVPGIRMSMSTMSGRCRRTAAIACTVPELVARQVSCGFAVWVDDAVVVFGLVYL